MKVRAETPRRTFRPITGILVLDKPQGLSSNGVLQRVKRFFSARKAGHTGSLDPLATGILVLCFGQATKLSRVLLEADKSYHATLRLGVRTASGDSESQVIAERPTEGLTTMVLERALEFFRGEITQIPPMYSAIKYRGRPLYRLARQGLEVPRAARYVTISKLELRAFRGQECDLEIHCSKGVYIRTIADNLGEKLGCGAHVTALRRVRLGPFSIIEAVTMETLQRIGEERGVSGLDGLLLPLAAILRGRPKIHLADDELHCLRHGRAVPVSSSIAQGWVSLVRSANGDAPEFLGLGELLTTGQLEPRFLLQ